MTAYVVLPDSGPTSLVSVNACWRPLNRSTIKVRTPSSATPKPPPMRVAAVNPNARSWTSSILIVSGSAVLAAAVGIVAMSLSHLLVDGRGLRDEGPKHAGNRGARECEHEGGHQDAPQALVPDQARAV